jgi:hypothetical protein
MMKLSIEKRDLEAYALLRMRIRDFMNFTLLWHRASEGHDLLEGLPSHGLPHLMETLRTASLGWLASLVDPHDAAVSAFVIWPKIFPHKIQEIAKVAALLEPHQKALQQFRCEVAFHSNKSIRRYLNARAAIKTPEFIQATDSFLGIVQTLLEEEGAIKDLPEALAKMEGGE